MTPPVRGLSANVEKVCACQTPECIKPLEQEFVTLISALEAKYPRKEDVPQRLGQEVLKIKKKAVGCIAALKKTLGAGQSD